jgi:hypothetical protein
VRPDGGVLAHEGAVDQRLVLQEGVEGTEHVALVVVPPEGVVLAAHRSFRVFRRLQMRFMGRRTTFCLKTKQLCFDEVGPSENCLSKAEW